MLYAAVSQLIDKEEWQFEEKIDENNRSIIDVEFDNGGQPFKFLFIIDKEDAMLNFRAINLIDEHDVKYTKKDFEIIDFVFDSYNVLGHIPVFCQNLDNRALSFNYKYENMGQTINVQTIENIVGVTVKMMEMISEQIAERISKIESEINLKSA